MFVCCECYVLSGRGLCNELITRPEESYRLWCIIVCDLETSRMRPWPALGRSATAKKKKNCRSLQSILCILSNKYFNYGFKNEQNIYWHSGLCTLIVITSKPKYVGVYVCYVRCVTKGICWIIY